MAEETTEKMRYFYVTYHGSKNNMGWFDIYTNRFPTLKFLLENASKYSDGDKCVITNIIELSREDWKTLMSER